MAARERLSLHPFSVVALDTGRRRSGPSGVVIPWFQDDALKVGYLATPIAITYGPVFETIGLRAIQCPARLKGGWDRGGMDRGNIGVVLQLGTPGELGVQLWLEDHSVSTAHTWVGKTVVFTGKSLFSVGIVPLGACVHRRWTAGA